MSELVIVPAWRRADFLLATLRRIECALNGDEVETWICLDRGARSDVLSVAEQFAARHNTRIRTTDHEFHGNSFNVLTAYFEAYNVHPAPALIHLIEEDVFIGRDYFDFHRRAHALCPDAFAVSACRNQNIEILPPADALAVYQHLSYQSLGVSFTPRQLARVLLHVRAEYFRDPVGYCAAMFPSYSNGTAFAEQDGLIRRVAEAAGLRVVYPALPRAYHAGFHGYNRKGQPMAGGTVDARAAALLAMTNAQLNAQARSHPDHETIDLDGDRPAVSHAINWP